VRLEQSPVRFAPPVLSSAKPQVLIVRSDQPVAPPIAVGVVVALGAGAGARGLRRAPAAQRRVVSHLLRHLRPSPHVCLSRCCGSVQGMLHPRMNRRRFLAFAGRACLTMNRSVWRAPKQMQNGGQVLPFAPTRAIPRPICRPLRIEFPGW
jgi:hypothetical protein